MTWDGKLHQRTGLDYTKVIKILKLLSINTTIKNSVCNSIWNHEKRGWVKQKKRFKSWRAKQVGEQKRIWNTGTQCKVLVEQELESQRER